MQAPHINTTSVYRRLSQVGLSVVLLTVVLSMWIDTANHGEQMLLDNDSVHTRRMLDQTTRVCVKPLKAKDIDGLTSILNHLSQDPFVLQAMLFDQNGETLARSDNALDVQQLYLKRQTLAQTLPPYGDNRVETIEQMQPPVRMYVEPVVDDGNLLGYLHIGYLQRQSLSRPMLIQHDSMQKLLLLMLLSGLIGFLLTRGFSRFSRNSYRLVE